MTHQMAALISNSVFY